jgi:hypothetical protein
MRLAWPTGDYHVGVQLVAEVQPDESDPETRWLSISGGEGFGFLIRRHVEKDSHASFDNWAHSLEDALAYGDAYGLSNVDWHQPDSEWLNAPPPVGFKGD